MNTSNVLLAGLGLAIGVIGTAVFLGTRGPCEPAAKYVIAWDGAEFTKDPPDTEGFINALSYPQKVTFRHGIKLRLSAGGPPTQPDGLKDIGLVSGFCFGNLHSPNGGLHVTQKAGFANQAALDEALSYLKK